MAKTFGEWLKTGDSEHSLDNSILKDGNDQYLYNRLKRAFDAGKESEDIPITLPIKELFTDLIERNKKGKVVFLNKYHISRIKQFLDYKTPEDF